MFMAQSDVLIYQATIFTAAKLKLRYSLYRHKLTFIYKKQHITSEGYSVNRQPRVKRLVISDHMRKIK